jgi:hypothetical protein
MDIPTISDFAADGNDPAHYRRLGGDWSIAVADVIGSTKLANQGRDRDVNFVAGAVVAVLSAVVTGHVDSAACQFGGDGAVAAVPPQCRAEAEAALKALGHWASVELDVPLRVGMVPVQALEEAGLDVLVALHDFGNGNAFGLFLGNGVPTAESWVKADARWRFEPCPGPLPGLEGLSCRWRPVPARRGVVMCVIADAIAQGAEGMAVLARLQAEIERIVPTEAAAPLGDGSRLVPKPLPTLHALLLEARTERRGRRLWRAVRAVTGSLILAAVHRLGGRVGWLDVGQYRRALAERSDYRKQAGGPRLVLDLTLDEADRLEALLAAAETAGEIRYGTARSDATTMTCLVGDFAADRHVHFVDGAKLGFWRASVVYKAKLGK